MHKVKSAPIHGFKALIDEGPGVFEAIVSVFGNVDLAGDRVLVGAFASSLSRWKASGDPIPVVFSHQWDDLEAHVGEVLEAEELPPGHEKLIGTGLEANGGLWVKARLDVEDPEEVFARRLWKRLEKRRIREFSFAYDVIVERRSTDGANDLVELDVIEVGPTLKGMNPATALLLAKSSGIADELLAAAKAGPLDLAAVESFLARLDAKAVPTHAYIPGEDDRCSVCGMTRNTSAHLHTLSTGADGAKAVVELAGSLEARQAEIFAAAVESIPTDGAAGGLYEVALEATFDDHAVFRVEGWDDPIGGGSFFEVSIADGDDGLEVGAPVEVVIEGTTRPKSSGPALVLVDRARSAVKNALGATVSADDEGKRDGKAEDLHGGKAEDPSSRTGAGTKSADAVRVELDALELELSADPAP